VYDGEEECLAEARRLLDFLPQNNMEDPPRKPTSDPFDRRDETLGQVVPNDPAQPYDIREVVLRVVDDADFMEVHREYAPSLVVGFARLGERSVGVLANQPAHLAGVLDINASIKGARFVRFCDCFNVPLVTFVDVPGFMPGTDQEFGGIIKHGAKLIYAYAEATVPKVSVLTRKAYGGAYIVMSSKHLRGDINYAWPSGEIAVMGPEGAVNIVFRDRIAKASDPDSERRRLVQEYRDRFANPYVAASRGYLDDVIEPRETRPRLIQALEVLRNKRDNLPPKKHGNIPL